ncbi:MAG: GNAT family N-acetyltransferase [Caulobacter sp. 12-67-6]|nr:MAG: GNAT family N-acetyltransferase [Caulobacter sp. 12-67-6]OYX71826.1 MAG: GNAT family N-acetyltransferase [Caulobacter sp. 32-67-35]OZA72795.1 MAG: GNAT family N-acetyltransferase [Caulobacter sp. 39-67-4]HQR89503.1 GNAT family N-acetyltransferase [Caulobacter sp.]
MLLATAQAHDLPAIAALVNAAYRGPSAQKGWTSETHMLDGQRTDVETLRADLAAKPGSTILILRETTTAPPLACVWLEPLRGDVWMIGMVTVDPERQDSGLGRKLLDAAESHARAHGGKTSKMTVIEGRDTLIAWYGRRGYQPTGESEPFPYGDARFGEPKLEGLKFLVLKKTL